MKNFLELFLKHCSVERNLSKNTIDAYGNDLLEYVRFLDQNTYELDSSGFEKFLINLTERGHSARSLNRKISSINQFYKFLFQNKYIDKNPVLNFQKPRSEVKIPHFLSQEEVDRLIASSIEFDKINGLRNAVIISLLYASGGRVSEVCGLKFSAFEFEDLENRLIKPQVLLFGKGSRERICPISKNAVDLIQRYISNLEDISGSDSLFPSKNNKPISRIYVGLMLKKAALLAGVDKKKVHPHALRHSIALKLLHGGMDIRVLQEFLGHKDISTTAIYTNINKSEVMKLVQDFHPLGKNGSDIKTD